MRGQQDGDPATSARDFPVTHALTQSFSKSMVSEAAGYWAKRCVGKKMKGGDGGVLVRERSVLRLRLHASVFYPTDTPLNSRKNLSPRVRAGWERALARCYMGFR